MKGRVDPYKVLNDRDGCLCGHGGRKHPWDWKDDHKAITVPVDLSKATCETCRDRWQSLVLDRQNALYGDPYSPVPMVGDAA